MQRRRFKNTLTFPDRLAKEAERFRQEADTKPPGQGASVAGYCSRIPEIGRTGMTDIIDPELFERLQRCDSDKLYRWWKQQPPELQPVIMEAMIEASLEYDYDFYLPYYRQKYGEKYRELIHRLKVNSKARSGPIIPE